MAGSTRQRCSIVDRHRRARDEGREIKSAFHELSTDGALQIQQASVAAGMDTQAFCDMNCRTFEVGIPSHLPMERQFTDSLHTKVASQGCEPQ
jgi:hypothetical protein